MAALVAVLSFALPAPEVLAGRQASDRAQQRHRHRTPPLLPSEGALGGPVGVRFQPRAPGSPGPAGRGAPSWCRAVGDRRHASPQPQESREGEGHLPGVYSCHVLFGRG